MRRSAFESGRVSVGAVVVRKGLVVPVEIHPAARPDHRSRLGEIGAQLPARHPLNVRLFVRHHPANTDRRIPGAVDQLGVDLDAVAAVVGLDEHAPTLRPGTQAVNVSRERQAVVATVRAA